jgi:hypothetical protein
MNRISAVFSQIRDDIRAIDIGRRSIRNFGITFFFVLEVIGGIIASKDNPAGYAVAGLGVAFLVLGLWAPMTLKAPYKIWMAFAAILGFFMSRIILGLLFYLVVTPIGVVMRLLGKDILDQRWDKKKPSYWIKKDGKAFDKKRYEKMF